jgi:hypothetical protein
MGGKERDERSLSSRKKDRARLKYSNRLAMVDGAVVDNGGHAIIRRERQELGIELIASADVDRLDRVIDTRLLEKESDLVAVRRRPVIEVDHREIRRLTCRG